MADITSKDDWAFYWAHQDAGSLLQVPAFARAHDYVGLWSVEPVAFATIWRLAASMDLAAHVREAIPQQAAAVETVPVADGKAIAVLRMNGILMKSASSLGGTSTVLLRRDIRAAANNPDISGILLVADTPGGTVSGTSDLADEVRAAGRQKPVWTHAEDLLASAGYWVASQSSRITANSATALIGSIGTVQTLYDASVAAEREGIRTIVLSTGPLKGMAAPGSKITDEQVNHVQGLVNAVQTSFDAAVQKGRSMSAKELAAVRHGGVLTATAAMEMRLIDAVQPLAKTIAEFSRALKPGSNRANFDTGAPASVGSLPMIRQSLPMLNKPELEQSHDL